VDRDLYGIQYEVELLEALLNRKETSEAELQQFLEEHRISSSRINSLAFFHTYA